MADLNFEKERIQITPIILYIDYITLHFQKYLKNKYSDITPRDFTYLSNIYYNQNCSQKQLADLLYVSESNVAQIIKKLEKNGLITRCSDKTNKSKKIINLSEKGKLILFSLIKDVYEWDAKIFDQYTKEEVELFKKMIYDYSNKSINNL